MSSLTTAGSMEYSVSEEEFDTRLSLEIGGGGGSQPPPAQRKTVQLFGEVLLLQDHGHHREPATRNKRESAAAGGGRQNKKARTFHGSEVGDHRSRSDGGGEGRKKLRLTSVQATLLEDSFRAHNILSHGEKQELARRVGLSARQVEVWFQNRRARTKLKQTEVDCELLRRWCDRLTDENARLRQDLAELRASASAAAVSVVCPSCCDRQQVAIVAACAGTAEMA